MNINKVEKTTLNKVKYAYFLMGFVGIATYISSNSQAVLIDGLFNLISALTLIIGIKISDIVVNKPTKSNPFGYAMYESLYTFFKGMLLLGINVVAFFPNILKVYKYLIGENVEGVKGEFIIIYAVVMVSFCLLVFFYLKRQSRAVNDESIMIKTERTVIFQNAIISGTVGLAFLIVGQLNGTRLEVIVPITDSILVILLVLVLIKDPIIIIKNVFKELTLSATSKEMRLEITNQLNDLIIDDNYYVDYVIITRLGRTVNFYIILNSKNDLVSVTEIDNIREQIDKYISKKYQYNLIDLVITNEKIV